ncbi:response regulator [Daejeonella lutea]|uniref:Response regulator receiver domain-containing protein n=1 Tax=Daejeonella lutea TaxID=572036 RepID=A0A1T5BMZ4_9SPHI|nr:response regulator [Daejeonella lutea]SKB48469.1 Response regulator receiver domain-containing protein [Daejeonella lutea]
MRKNLFIVERDPDILNILTHIFQDHGYVVTPFSAEFGVLERIQNEKPDAVLLDIIRPTAESTILCREIKADPELKYTPIIALSTHMEPHKIHSICADKVIGKPFDISDLIDAVESELAE